MCVCPFVVVKKRDSKNVVVMLYVVQLDAWAPSLNQSTSLTQCHFSTTIETH